LATTSRTLAGGQPAGLPGVDEPAQRVHQHRPHELAGLRLYRVELVQGLRLQHDDHLRSAPEGFAGGPHHP